MTSADGTRWGLGGGFVHGRMIEAKDPNPDPTQTSLPWSNWNSPLLLANATERRAFSVFISEKASRAVKPPSHVRRCGNERGPRARGGGCFWGIWAASEICRGVRSSQSAGGDDDAVSVLRLALLSSWGTTGPL